MCKHVAAVFYGIGARLDDRPELLFQLRKVDEKDLIAKAGSGLPLSKKGPGADKVLAADDLAEMFGLEMAGAEDDAAPASAPARAKVKVNTTVHPCAGSSKPPSSLFRKGGKRGFDALEKPCQAESTRKVRCSDKVNTKVKAPAKTTTKRATARPKRTAATQAKRASRAGTSMVKAGIPENPLGKTKKKPGRPKKK